MLTEISTALSGIGSSASCSPNDDSMPLDRFSILRRRPHHEDSDHRLLAASRLLSATAEHHLHDGKSEEAHGAVVTSIVKTLWTCKCADQEDTDDNQRAEW